MISYYDRYKFPLIGTEAALVVFGVHRTWDLFWALIRKEPAALPVSKPLRLPLKGKPVHTKAASFVRVPCSGCTASLKVKAELAGKKVRCPRCGGVLRVC
jgi:hypothetical protein